MGFPDSWASLAGASPPAAPGDWLETLLAASAGTAYLRQHGSPRNQREFRERVPVASYEELLPWLTRVEQGAADVLFPGRPVAYERTGGSAGRGKLIPYSAAGLDAFRRALLPWLAGAARHFGVRGRVYLSLSPATRAVEHVGDIPVGLPDSAYLGEVAAAALAELSAVPLDLASQPDVARWRAQTLEHLESARDLELISVWSPTFLLRLLDDIADPVRAWPRLKLVSCWAAAGSASSAQDLAARLPHAHLQPKGLVSTECAVTVPDDEDHPVLTGHGFFEFAREGRLCLAEELRAGETYSVIATTASGLYRYRTGDLVRSEGRAACGRPILAFVGRGGLVCDLVGEKLTEPFVADCLRDVPGFRLLVPRAEGRGYVLAVEAGVAVSALRIEQRLAENPQYAYARKLGQLEPLRLLEVGNLYDRYVQAQLEAGARLGEIKPVALRSEREWIRRFGGRA